MCLYISTLQARPQAELSVGPADVSTVFLSCRVSVDNVKKVIVKRTTQTNNKGNPIFSEDYRFSLYPSTDNSHIVTGFDSIGDYYSTYYYQPLTILTSEGTTISISTENWSALPSPLLFWQAGNDDIASRDARFDSLTYAEYHYHLKTFSSLPEWNDYRTTLLEHLKIATGLSPFFDSSSIGRITFTDSLVFPSYIVYNVFFESFDGFLCTGNLYKPLTGTPPYPAIACPHGHWKKGRFEHRTLVSVPNRCINLARMGCYVFSYDMVGYRDSYQLHHWFDGYEKLGVVMNDTLALWGISGMGLMLLNGIRAVDFLSSLPDVDTARIGMTGASGGGSATFCNTALDNRIKVSVPVNMTSSIQQGGCICCNAPALRYWTNDVEVTALAAPRPLHLISASGDWTTNTPKVEFPAIQAIYNLYDRPENISNTHVNAKHNYNLESRESAYRFFGSRFLGLPDTITISEEPFDVNNIDPLSVFASHPLPEYAKSASELIEFLITIRRNLFERTLPRTSATAALFKARYGKLLRHILSIDNMQPPSLDTTVTTCYDLGSSSIINFILSSNYAGSAIPVTMHLPASINPAKDSVKVVLYVHSEGRSRLYDPDRELYKFLNAQVDSGYIVVTADPFGIGEHQPVSSSIREETYLEYMERLKDNDSLLLLSRRSHSAERFAQQSVTEYEIAARRAANPLSNFFISFNKTDCLLRIEDIYHVLTYLQKCMAIRQLTCVGLGDAGLWCTLALTQTPPISKAILDLNGFNSNLTKEYTQRLFIPHIRAVGGLSGAAGCIKADHVLLFNFGGDSLHASRTQIIYNSLNRSDSLYLTTLPVLSSDIHTIVVENKGFNQLTEKYHFDRPPPPPVESEKKPDRDYIRATVSGGGTITLNYSVNTPVSTGIVTLYRLSGQLLKKAYIKAPKGNWSYKLRNSAPGIYCLRLRWGKMAKSIILPVMR